MPRQIHQMLPTVHSGDAIGNLVFDLRSLFRDWGYVSEIFAETWDRRFSKACHSYKEYKRFCHPDNILLLHYATGGQVNRFVENVPDRVILQYHGLTPAHFFYWVNGTLAHELLGARRDLEALGGRFPAISDSIYNQQELESMGFQVLGVVPPILSFDHLDPEPSATGTGQPQRGPEKLDTVDWLHVGRLVPNKCIHDVIKCFYYYHTWITPRSRLFIVGSGREMQPYIDELRQLVARLGLNESVILTGHVENPARFYQLADVYISMSEHEGFCIPLVEAMRYDVPVFAYASTAIPYTLGDAGVLFHHKEYSLIAEMVHQVVTDDSLKKNLIRRQRARLAAFAPNIARAQLRECLERASHP
jgi:L-malate glycosyltransferase